MTKNQFLQSVIFILLLGFSLCGIQYYVEWGVRCNTYGESGKINLLMSHQIDPELMIFGSSVALVQLDDSLITAQTGMTTVNMGLSGVSFQQYRGLAKEFASYTTKCKYVVFVNTPFELITRNLLYEAFNFYAHLGNSTMYKSLAEIDPVLVNKMKYIPCYPLTVYGSHFYRLSREGHKERKGIKPHAPKPDGFLPVNIFQFNDESLRNVQNHSLNIPVSDTMVNYFKEIISLYNAKGIKVILLSPPVEKGMNDRISNGEQLAATWQQLAGTKNYFMNYDTDSLGTQRELFYNFTHLNSKGAAVFSKKFASDLKTLVH
ncbi:MAG: hypothetical protein IT247_06850 [Bacteroidia bacterium]|nr:hypothetical protein [Bacteroidia bacterium]